MTAKKRAADLRTANAYRVEGRGAWLYYGPNVSATWVSLLTIEGLIHKAVAWGTDETTFRPLGVQPVTVPLSILEDASHAIRETL